MADPVALEDATDIVRVPLSCPRCGAVMRWDDEDESRRQTEWRRSAILSCPEHGEHVLAVHLSSRQPGGAGKPTRKAQHRRPDPLPGEHAMYSEVLRARCWCDRREVDVPVGDVRSGRTKSCGLPGCNDTTTRRPAS